MGNVIGLMGESGSGKTTAMRNLDPKTTMYVDCDKKGLSWKGWKNAFNTDAQNYIVTDDYNMAQTILDTVDKSADFKHIKTLVYDTINGLMVADEMRRMQEKGYDKWVDLASAVYDLIDSALTTRSDLTVIFLAHTQTERDENGFEFTRIKTNGKKLEKIVLESKMTTVLLAKNKDGQFIFETQSSRSTAKAPLGLLKDKEIPNDITIVLKAFEEF